ncbi:MAG TPA: hypothetical protein VK167_13530 [Flavipsychrobacter sp.]|nr:hypothetical protein [Chitinophagales bacterium]HLO71892.1 hypothetical protein [Flavipsychrobacter sp.]
MSLLNGGKNNAKKGAKGAKPTAAPGAKSFVKPGKTANISKKPIKTGGTRGS